MTDDDDDEITEEMVEGIYIEHLHRIETLPGYAEGFERISKLMKRVIDEDKPEPPDDELAHEMMKLHYLVMTGKPWPETKT